MKSCRLSCAASAAAVLVAAVGAGIAPKAIAQSTRAVAITGDDVPEGNGNFLSFTETVLNNAGQVAFSSRLDSTGDGVPDSKGLYRSDPTALTLIGRSGQTAPDNDGVFVDFGFILINDAGKVGFVSNLTGTSGGDDARGIFLGDGTTRTQIIRQGQAAPDDNGTFSGAWFYSVSLNEVGQVAFQDLLMDTSGGDGDNWGIFRGDGTALTQIARTGQPPFGEGSNSSLQWFNPAINNAGQVTYIANLSNPTGRAIFRDDGVTANTIAITRQNAPANNDNSILAILGGYASSNNVGQTAFFSFLLTEQGTTFGIFRGDGTTLTQIVTDGQTAPNENGVFTPQFRTETLAINDAGQTAFYAELGNTSGRLTDNTGLFFGDGTTLTQIVREGQAAPDGSGTFDDFSDYNPSLAINDTGQAAFYAKFNGGGDGIFFFDESLGLLQVARENDSLFGSRIADLQFVNPFASSEESNGFNNLGQVAYRFKLSDGRSGIALWSPPDPDRLVGDYDGNGEVGQGDLDLVLQSWGVAATAGLPPDRAWADASDITGELIGQDELARVLQNWGNLAAISAELDDITNATGLSDDQVLDLVPEPSTATLTLAALMLGLGLRSRNA